MLEKYDNHGLASYLLAQVYDGVIGYKAVSYTHLGLPTILFFNQDGKEIEGSRVNGFMSPVEFLQWIEKISKP